MIIAAILVMLIGVLTTGAAVAMEIHKRERIWGIIMKVGAAAFAIGGVLFGVAMRLA